MRALNSVRWHGALSGPLTQGLDLFRHDDGERLGLRDGVFYVLLRKRSTSCMCFVPRRDDGLFDFSAGETVAHLGQSLQIELIERSLALIQVNGEDLGARFRFWQVDKKYFIETSFA